MTQDSPPNIDFNAISFPTDAMTVGDLRRREFARLATEDRGLYDELHTMAVMQAIAAEMDVAEAAFGKAVSGRDPLDGLQSEKALVRDLVNLYEELGIGEGPASRTTLVQRIQADAKAQAEAKAGHAK